jgi:ubiquinone/menaquinone biosynthesis C-methylase UbiE
MENPFEELAEKYDAWYDSRKGRKIFDFELRALGKVSFPHPSLEIGVGTGRFAKELRIEVGADIAKEMLKIAKMRGIETVLSDAHKLPFKSRSFKTSYFITTLCFLKDPERALREAARVSENIVVGFIPEESPLGRFYIQKGQEGHPLYTHARFLSCSQLIEILEKAGFRIIEAYATLFTLPESEYLERETIKRGIHPSAGFNVIFATLREPSSKPP